MSRLTGQHSEGECLRYTARWIDRLISKTAAAYEFTTVSKPNGYPDDLAGVGS